MGTNNEHHKRMQHVVPFNFNVQKWTIGSLRNLNGLPTYLVQKNLITSRDMSTAYISGRICTYNFKEPFRKPFLLVTINKS
jgi:hypothetical protein